MPASKRPNNRIYEAYLSCRDGLVQSIMKMSVKQQDVDDILQETFTRVLRTDKTQEIQSPKGYLFAVSRNLVLKKLGEQSKVIHAEIDEALLEPDSDASLESDLYQKAKFQHLSNALSSLPENHRRAILLRKLYCLSHKEIANKMNISVSSVEKYIAKGLMQCKQSLDIRGFDDNEPVNRKKESRPEEERVK